MKKLLAIFLILASCGDKSSDPKPDTSKNQVETFAISGQTNLLPGYVEYFWQRAENSGITYPKGITVKGVQIDETSTLVDNSSFSGKVINLDIQYINSLYVISPSLVITHVSRMVGRVVAPQHQTCSNKITDFMDETLRPQLVGTHQQWVDTMVGASEDCPL